MQTPSFTLTGDMAATNLDDDARFNVDMFPFNDVLIVNDGISQPIVLFRNDDDDYVARFILGWPNGVSDLAQAATDVRVTAERMTHYNNRLIALNVSGNYLGDDADDDGDDVQYGNVSLLWSTPKQPKHTQHLSLIHISEPTRPY